MKPQSQKGIIGWLILFIFFLGIGTLGWMLYPSKTENQLANAVNEPSFEQTKKPDSKPNSEKTTVQKTADAETSKVPTVNQNVPIINDQVADKPEHEVNQKVKNHGSNQSQNNDKEHAKGKSTTKKTDNLPKTTTTNKTAHLSGIKTLKPSDIQTGIASSNPVVLKKSITDRPTLIKASNGTLIQNQMDIWPIQLRDDYYLLLKVPQAERADPILNAELLKYTVKNPYDVFRLKLLTGMNTYRSEVTSEIFSNAFGINSTGQHFGVALLRDRFIVQL